MKALHLWFPARSFSWFHFTFDSMSMVFIEQTFVSGAQTVYRASAIPCLGNRAINRVYSSLFCLFEAFLMYNESIDSDFCLPYLARSLVRVLKTARSLGNHGLCRNMESWRKMAVCGTLPLQSTIVNHATNYQGGCTDYSSHSRLLSEVKQHEWSDQSSPKESSETWKYAHTAFTIHLVM